MEKTKKERLWENVAVLCFALTVLGQGLVGGLYLVAQGVWLIANVISLARNVVLERPTADKVRDGGLIGLTTALIALRVLGIYQERFLMNAQDIVLLLNDSQDAETIALEITSHPSLYDIISVLANEWDAELGQEMIATLIRELWDIAYSHGYYDGQTEAKEGII